MTAVAPDGCEWTPVSRLTLYYRRAAFRDFVDLLRHEGPVYLAWRNESIAALGTGFEPVGDRERHP